MAAWPVSPEAEAVLLLCCWLMYTGQIGVFCRAGYALLFFLFWELELISGVSAAIPSGACKKRLYAVRPSLFLLPLQAVPLVHSGGGAVPWPSTCDTITLRHSPCWRKRSILCECQPKFVLRPPFCWPIVVNYWRLFPCTPGLPDVHGEATAPVHSCPLAWDSAEDVGSTSIIRIEPGYAARSSRLLWRPGTGNFWDCVNIILRGVDLLCPAQPEAEDRLFLHLPQWASCWWGNFSFSALGLGGAVLQMVSPGLIGAACSFWWGATYDRTHTPHLERDGRRRPENCDPDHCHRFTACSPGLPGIRRVMSGFVAD